ncbi:hypothetical protein D9M68_385090 [compost metagenome]
MLADLAGVRVDVDDVAHVHVGDVELDRQGAGVFHGVVEDRGDLVAEAEAACALVRHVGDVVAEEPQHRVGGGLAGGTGTDHVTDVGDREALGLDRFDLLQRADGAGLYRLDAVAGHLQHGQGVQRDVGAGPGVRSRGQVVGVGFARDLEHGQGDLLGQGRLGFEPLAVSPGLQHGLGRGIALLGALGDVVEGVEHQQGVLQLLGGGVGQLGAVQQFDQGGDVVAALHGAQQLDGAGLVDQRGSGFALGDGGEEAGLDVGCFVHARRNAIGDQVQKELLFAGRRVLQQFDQACGLLGVQRLGYDTQGSTLFYVFAVGFKHSISLISGPGGRVSRRSHRSIRQAWWTVIHGPTTAPAASRQKLFSKFYAGRPGTRVGGRSREVPTPCGCRYLCS